MVLRKLSSDFSISNKYYINSVTCLNRVLLGPDFLTGLDKKAGLDTGLDLHRITSGFHRASATGVASKKGTLTLPDTWFRSPFGDLLMLQLLRPVLPNLPYLFSTFHLEYPSVLSRFCIVTYVLDGTKYDIRYKQDAGLNKDRLRQVTLYMSLRKLCLQIISQSNKYCINYMYIYNYCTL